MNAVYCFPKHCVIAGTAFRWDAKVSQVSTIINLSMKLLNFLEMLLPPFACDQTNPRWASCLLRSRCSHKLFTSCTQLHGFNTAIWLTRFLYISCRDAKMLVPFLFKYRSEYPSFQVVGCSSNDPEPGKWVGCLLSILFSLTTLLLLKFEQPKQNGLPGKQWGFLFFL